MKAKDLAEELLKNPDFEVEVSIWVNGQESRRPALSNCKIEGIADVGYSNKIIVLDGRIDE